MHRELHIEHEEVAIETGPESEAISIAHELVQRVLDNPQELGRGRTAVVNMFSDDERFQDYCVKQVLDASSTYLLHDIDTEMRYQMEALKLGVRVPKPILSLTTTEGEQFMVMETIKGHNLEEIIGRGLPLPPQFDAGKFWTKLEAMLETLHKNNLYHRDIQPRNLMLEYETGEPVLIDFNYATRAGGDEDPYHEVHTLRGQMDRFMDDNDKLRECRVELQQYLTK
jgi:tRNA A-37 threonylcarbamoyl transferase component Bud32